MKYDKMTIANSDILGGKTLKGVLIRDTGKTVIVMIKDGNNVNINKYHGIENKEEIDFNDNVKEQEFVLSDWQMNNLCFYDGKCVNDNDNRIMKGNYYYEMSQKERMALRDVKLSYENAVEFYKEIVSRDVQVKEDMGGFGNVHIEGIELNRLISKIIKLWADSNPKYAFFDRGKNRERNKMTLYFSVHLSEKLWRLECIEPKRKAHERFIMMLTSMGHRMLGVSVEKTVVKKKRRYRRTIKIEEEEEHVL